MTGRELRAARQRLGVTVQWCADHVGCVNRRTWQFWEAGRNGLPVTIPDYVQSRMLALEGAVWKALERRP